MGKRAKREREYVRRINAETAHLKMPPKQKCVAESEDVCRHLVCPRHRRRLAFCPWSANGRETLSK